MSVPNLNKGIRFDHLGAICIYGTSSSIADLDLVKKPVSPLGTRKHVCIKEGEGAYIYDNGVISKGLNLPVAEAVFESGATTEVNIVKLTSTLVVACFVDGSDTYAKAIAGTVAAGGAITWGTAVNVNEALSDSLGICRVSDSSFAISYRDNTGTTGYACVKMGSVSTTTITLGDEVELTNAAVDGYTDVCCPRSDYLTIGYVLTSDSAGYVIAIDFSGTTLGTAGTAVAINDTTTYLRMKSHDNGVCLAVFRDGGASNYASAVVVTCSDAGVISVGGSVTALNAVAATYTDLDIISATAAVFTYVASTYCHVVSASISGDTITPGTAVALNSSATKYTRIVALGANKFIVVYEDDGAATDYGRYHLCSRTAEDVVASIKEHTFAIGATAEPAICSLNEDSVVIAFKDEGDSNKGKAITGYYNESLIDVRSSAASKAYRLWVMPYLGRIRDF